MPITPDPPFPKTQGDNIRSKDWNDAVNEVIRLDNAKANRSGDRFTGPLTIDGNVDLSAELRIPKTGDGSAVFTNQRWGNEDNFRPNNLKLRMGHLPFDATSLPKLPEHEFAIGFSFDNAPGVDPFFQKTFSVNEKGDLFCAGSIRSPMWNVHQLLNQKSGALPMFGRFISNGGTLLLFASGSGFRRPSSGAGFIALEVSIDGVPVGRAHTFTNEVDSHKAFIPAFFVTGPIGAGDHSFTVIAVESTQTDDNDITTLTILELPW